MKEKLESYIKYMIERKAFIHYCLRDYKAKLQFAKEDSKKIQIEYWTNQIQKTEEELKMIKDIIDYLQLEHYKYC